MAFDPNSGEWVNNLTTAPGPSGGAGPILDLMNVGQSAQNYQRKLQGDQFLEFLRAMASPNAQAAINTPQASTVTGMTPDQLQQSYGQTPMGQYHAYADQNPDMNEDQAYQEQVRLGMASPSSLGSYARTGMMDQAKMERLRVVMEQKYGKDNADNIVKYIGMGFSPQQAADIVTSAPTGTVAPGIGASPTATSKMGLNTALTGKATAQGNEAQAKADTIGKDVDSRIALRAAQAQALGFLAEYRDAVTQGLTGAITPEQRQKGFKIIADADEKIAKYVNDPKTKAAIAAGGDSKKAAIAELHNMQQTRNEVAETIRGNAPVRKTLSKPAGAAAPAGGGIRYKFDPTTNDIVPQAQ